jgi:hypothetical protein
MEQHRRITKNISKLTVDMSILFTEQQKLHRVIMKRKPSLLE